MGQDHMPPESKPNLFLLVNGKRKCGKDFMTEILIKKLQEKQIDHAVMRIAEPIKYYWAQKYSLEFDKLLDTSAYKEQHRFGMVQWSQEVRADNYGYWNVEAIRMANAEGKPIWICVDIRHKKDYEWFLQYYSPVIKRVRIQADEEVRKTRGWTYTEGVDNGPSECDLDDVTDWDLVVTNNGAEDLNESVSTILSWIEKAL